MKLDEQLRSAYQEETKDWVISARVKHNIIKATRKETSGVHRSRTWWVAVLIALVFLIPTGAYAGYTYLADSIYGSQDQITSRGGKASDYEQLEAKLQRAKAHFTENEFEQFMGLLKEYGQMATTHADVQGKMNPEQWSTAEQEKFKGLAAELQPFFDKLESLENKSSRAIPVSPRLMDEETFWMEQSAKAEELFTKEQYADFKSIYEQMKQYKTIVENPDGSYHMDRMSTDQRSDLDQLTERMSVYLEKLGLEVR
ncbi:hypothetical protein PAECIP112173_03916 [Paenibacillus sp. JJ-100]|uniref:DUF3600 domain-containing protein n=1 Tax=Paenibacillus sp. JJ-100 TaxID=2974896 RepID=UPI0022FFB093|nr:DUF3600 domain-containing protein [Paenibacillus sp. JJ-100]CAI6083442.1 hypothetical protein PAECIP112173_03916 [Paenibacillus sp. JJ-100]